MDANLKRTRPASTGRGSAMQAWQTAQPLYGTAPRLRLPPYGREVEAALSAGQHPNVRLYACRNGWELAKQRRYTFGPGSTLLLPPGDDPEAYRWPCVRELIANVTGLEGAQLQRLARALVRAGCWLAYLLDAEHAERNLRVIATRGVQ